MCEERRGYASWVIMKRFVGGSGSSTVDASAGGLDDWNYEENPVRGIDAFVDALDLASLGFHGVEPAATGRPAFRPSVTSRLPIALKGACLPRSTCGFFAIFEASAGRGGCG